MSSRPVKEMTDNGSDIPRTPNVKTPAVVSEEASVTACTASASFIMASCPLFDGRQKACFPWVESNVLEFANERHAIYVTI